MARTLTQKLNLFGPSLCRLIAAPATTRQIALRSGLSKSYVHQLSLKTSWDDVPVGTVEKFSRACGIDLLLTRRHKERLRKKLRSMLRLAKTVRPTQRNLLARLLTNARLPTKDAA